MHGIGLESDITLFWEFCASQMAVREDKEACARLAVYLKHEYFALFVESMFDLTRKEMECALLECGGKVRWLRVVETLLGRRFADVANVPASALVLSARSNEPISFSDIDSSDEASEALATRAGGRSELLGGTCDPSAMDEPVAGAARCSVRARRQCAYSQPRAS